MAGPAPDAGLAAARVAQGPGGMLKQAREAAGMSRAALAARTRLDVKVIEALEDEAYERLAAAAFIRGYIRSFAKELRIDPIPILNQFENQAHQDDPALADFSTRSPLQITSSSALIRGISVALVVTILVLVALWWHHYYQQHAQSAEGLKELTTEEPTAPPPEPGTPLAYNYTIVEHSEPAADTVNSWRHQTDGSAAPDEGPMAEDTPHESVNTAPAEAAAKTPEAEAPAPTAATSGEVELSATSDSWVEVADVAGKRLYFGLIKPGQKVGVSGKAPYDVLIGNSAVVSLVFRGAAYDLKSQSINGVARFSLGELR